MYDSSIEVPRSIAVDFDGTLSYSAIAYPNVYKDDINVKLVNYLKRWQDNGGVVILNTARRRSNGTVQPVLDVLSEYGFTPDYVNQNIKEGIKKYGDCRKIVADYYLDDRSLSIQEFYNLVDYNTVFSPVSELSAEEGSVSKFRYLTDDLADVLQKKNKAYGNSFDKEMDEWGLSALCIRLADKYSRLKNLVKNPDIDYGDEALYDTLKDLAGYAVLGMNYLNSKGAEDKDGEN